MSDTQRSKLLSLLLRHDPAKAGLTLGEGGWVSVDDLLAGLDRLGSPLTRDELDRLVADSDKKRFSLSDDGASIRAAQGHSVEVELALTPRTPPDLLYHGTATRFIDAIMLEGLRPMSRRHVHLSADTPTATAVGQRHGKPAILQIDAGSMSGRGALFFQADNGVWLVEAVPPEFLSFNPVH